MITEQEHDLEPEPTDDKYPDDLTPFVQALFDAVDKGII